MTPLILVGGGGHCRSCIEVIQSSEKFVIIGIIDKPEYIGTHILDVPFIDIDENIPKIIKQGTYNFHITLGQIKSSLARQKLTKIIQEANGKLPTITANSVIISNNAVIGDGTILMHRVFVNSGVNIGNACIINTGALLEHDVKIGNFCHISTMSILNGGVQISDNCFIGSGAVIANNITICAGCVIGAGSVVIRSITQLGTYVGNPAKKIS